MVADARIAVPCPACGRARVVKCRKGPKALAMVLATPCRRCADRAAGARVSARAEAAARASGKPLCVHCGRFLGSRPGRLCNGCHDLPAVRERYVRVKHRRHASAGLPPSPVLPPGPPTDTQPGSPERVAVYAGRVAEGRPVFSPGDAVVKCRAMYERRAG